MKINFANNRAQLSPTCPCGKSNKDGKFAPAKNDPNKGYCHSCGKTFVGDETEFVKLIPEPTKPTNYHPTELMIKSFKNDKNNFVNFLKSNFDPVKVEEVTAKYNIGSSKHWQGATIFWQTDDLNRVRYGKVMLYDEKTGKRVKEPFSHFTTVHSLLKLDNFNHKQCLFGLHLLNDNNKPIAIVESEKTAVIMAITDDSYLWLATGGKGNFTYKILEPLKDKKVTAFPDCGETLWDEISDRLNQTGFTITINKILDDENNPKGYDLADVVLEEWKEIKQLQQNTDVPSQYENKPQKYTIVERVKVGLQFDTKELKTLAELMIPESDSRTEKQLIHALNQLEGLHEQDSKDLILVLQIKDIITKTNTGQYFLNNSTPY